MKIACFLLVLLSPLCFKAQEADSLKIAGMINSINNITDNSDYRLLANAAAPMPVQKEALQAAFTVWKGDLEQVDDVCILGVKIH